MAKSIKDSFHSDFFSNQKSNIFLLDEKEAKDIWESFIDKSASSYYRLNESHWIGLQQGEVIAKWDIDFNNGVFNRLNGILEENLDWADQDVIWFCINKYNIIESSWLEFKQKWINFFYCEYDGVIILNKFHESKVLLVLSNDYIYQINRPDSNANTG